MAACQAGLQAGLLGQVTGNQGFPASDLTDSVQNCRLDWTVASLLTEQLFLEGTWSCLDNTRPHFGTGEGQKTENNMAPLKLLSAGEAQ